MLDHIVKNNETLTDILHMYHLEFEELAAANRHITDYNNLLAGTKIKIPLLTNEVKQILENTESFVQKYYPKITEVISEPKEDSLKSEEAEQLRTEQEPPLQLKMQAQPPQAKTQPSPPQGRAYPGILPPNLPRNYKKI